MEITRHLPKDSFRSSYQTFEENEVYKTFDDKYPDNGWNPMSDKNQYIIINFLKKYKLQKLIFKPYQNRCKNVKIYKSFDGNFFTDIKSYTSSLEEKENIIELNNVTTKYLKFEVKNTYEGNIFILDIKIYGQPINCFYLLKQNDKYYSIKSDFYDKEKKVYLPCEQDFDKNGIDDLSELTKYISFGEEIFNPIMKFKGEIELIQAEEK